MAERDPKTGRYPKGNGAGSGAGWGGPAKGAGAAPIDASEYGDAIRALARDPKHMESKAVLRELVFATWVQVATSSEQDSARVSAADKIMERLDGKATGTMLMGGAEGATPIVIERRIVDPAAQE